MRGARPDVLDVEEFSEFLRAARVTDVSVAQDEIGQSIHAARTQKWLDDGLKRIGGAAVDECVTRFAGRVEENGSSAVLREDGQFRDGGALPALPGPRTNQKSGEGAFPEAPARCKHPAGEGRDQNEIV